MNAEIVLAHEEHWRDFFLSKPQQYELVWHKRPFMIFKRINFVSNYFLAGSGEIIEQTKNSVRLKLGSSEAVIKFNYFPFLTAGDCQLSPYDAGLEFPLVKISNCPLNSEIVLRSLSPISRLLQ